MTVFHDAGLLIVGSRMKRIGDRFLSEVSKVYKHQSIPFESAWFPIIYILDKKGPLSLTEISNALEISHSAISQMITQLQDKDIVEIIPHETDARVKRICFTFKGQNLLSQVHDVWQALIHTLDDILPKEEQIIFLQSLSTLEEKITSGFMAGQTLKILNASPVAIQCLDADKLLKKKVVNWSKVAGIAFAPGNNPLLVALSQNEIVGFVSYIYDKGMVEVRYIYIASVFRRQGIGTRLMESLYHSFMGTENGCFHLGEPDLAVIKLLIQLNYSFKVK